jgi:aldose 1-epimerase
MPRTRHFGELPDGRAVTAYDLGSAGVRLTVLDLGATVQQLAVPDFAGGGVGVVLGYDDVEGYLSPGNAYLGAVVGRYANRIAGARFTLDGVIHHLTKNEGDTCLHGGVDGFHRRLWTLVDHSDAALTMELVSPDGDQGFPGALTARARYEVTRAAVSLELTATCDRATVVSLTNHAYFNLGGVGRGTIDDHVLTVDADDYLPVDERSIPLGHHQSVAGTPFDFRAGARVGERMRQPHQQLSLTQGIDHAYRLRGKGMRRAARLTHPPSGRVLEVNTDQPSLQVYTGNFLDATTDGHEGRALRQGDGIALETQRHPDAPNQAALGESILRPVEGYSSTIQWRFSMDAAAGGVRSARPLSRG